MANYRKKLTWIEVAKLVQAELQKAQTLAFIRDESIVIQPLGEQDIHPTFQDYLIKLSAPEGGMTWNRPKIGNRAVYFYAIAVEIYVKRSRLLEIGIAEGDVSKSIALDEVFKRTCDVLEHNKFENMLDGYPGTCIGQSVPLQMPLSDNSFDEGIGFIWYGCQHNEIKEF